MEKLQNEMMEAIKKNLPEATAGELKKFLEEAKKLKEDYDLLVIRNTSLKETNDALNKLNLTNENLKAKEATLLAKEKELEQKEISQKVTILEIQLQEAKAPSAEVHGLVAILVKNPMAIELMRSTNSIPVANQYGSINYANETKEEKIIKGHTKANNPGQFTNEEDIS